MLRFQKKDHLGLGTGRQSNRTSWYHRLLMELESLKALCDVAKGHIGPVCH